MPKDGAFGAPSDTEASERTESQEAVENAPEGQLDGLDGGTE